MVAAEYPKFYLYKRIVQAKLYIDENFALDIDLDNISSEASFSKFHFIRLFKKIYGRSPHQHLTVVRIEQAMRLLRMNTSVTETCFAVGFQSISSFTTLFKRHTGVPPSVFLQRHQQMMLTVVKKPLLFIPGCFASMNGWK
ncbi:MAG TPA: AraC family transcriptional regulator [Chryseosolibacter sp.]|nr:AraC family transcriptional regulator [Chryseosolibacter sp.]